MTNILAGFVGAIVGLAGVLLGAWVTSRTEDRRWLREQTLNGAVEMTTAAYRLYEYRTLPPAERPPVSEARLTEWEERLESGRTVIHLLCGPEARRRADDFAQRVERTTGPVTDTMNAEAVAELQAFTHAVRRELGSARSDGT